MNWNRRIWTLLLAWIGAASFQTVAATAAVGARLIPQPASAASFVLDGDGRLWTWGGNESGELGDGSLACRARPQAVPFPAGVTRWQSVSAGSRVLALDQAGRLWGWGAASLVRIGVALKRQPMPVAIGGPTNRWRLVASAAAGNVDLTLDAAGEAFVWRFPTAAPPGGVAPFANYQAEPVARPAGVTRWLDAVAGRRHLLLRSDAGRLFFLGVNEGGTAGPLGLTSTEEQFVEVSSPKPGRQWLAVAAGADQSYGQLSDGEWYFWGVSPEPVDGRIVLRPQPEPSVLIRPDGVEAWRRVVGGATFALLLTGDGRTFGLGDNSLGKLAYPRGYDWSVSFTNAPRRVFPVGPIAQHVRDISAGLNHAMVLGEDGLLYSWGANEAGQLGRAANGSDWRPANVRGTAAPFSPAAPALPQLGWRPIEPALIAPMLAGAPGQSARFELHRPDTNTLRIPIRLELTSPHSLPGLPLDRLELQVNGVPQDSLLTEFQFLPPERILQLALAPRFGTGPGVAASLGIRAVVPPWVEWAGPDITPLSLGFPAPLSLPPSGFIERIPVARWTAGETNWVPVIVSDPDGFVTTVELYADCAPLPCDPPEFIGRQRLERGFPRVVLPLRFPWVPAEVGPRRFVLVLRDNAGSVVTNRVSTVSVVAPERFRLSWSDPAPVVEAPTSLAVRLEDLRGGGAVSLARIELIDESSGAVVEAGSVASLPGQVQFHFDRRGSFAATATVRTLDGGETTASSSPVKVVTEAGLPTVILEASDPAASEAGLDPGEIRLTRFGGNLARALGVSLSVGLPPAGAVPPPRLGLNPRAVRDVDFAAIPSRTTFPAGVRSITIPIRPLADDETEGNEGINVVLGSGLNVYETLPGMASALVILHDRATNSVTTAELTVSARDGRHPATQPLVVRLRGTNAAVGLEALELVADNWVVGLGPTVTLAPPLPLGPLTLWARATDRLGGVMESAPVTLEIVPELRLALRLPEPDGTERWHVSLQPDFTDLQLESSNDLLEWRPIEVFRPTPLIRVFEVPFTADRPARFLRVVPAP